jgi:MoxR-like ATPase
MDQPMHDIVRSIQDNLTRVILGKDDLTQQVLVALFSGGNMLLEDVPGAGKTTLAKALAKSVNADYNRIQFTPDLLPADILGSSIFNLQTSQFTFRKGPIFTNILLADEINRASPRTQSALLEAMTEGKRQSKGSVILSMHRSS